MNHSATPPTETPLPSSRLKRPILLILIPALLAVTVALIYLNGGRYVETDNAYIKAEKVPISAEVTGSVAKVMVAENQQVTAGEALFSLDPLPFQIALAQAEARLAAVRTDLAAKKASYREKQAEIALARTRHEFALRERARQGELAARHFISAAKLDESIQNAEMAGQQMAALELDLQRIAETLGGIDLPIEQHPAYLAAAAEVAQARLNLDRVVVRAPASGAVSKLPKVGQHLASGNAAMVLVASDHLWVEANFPEMDLTHVHPGQQVSITVDTYPERFWRGSVESLSPATGSEFSVIPAQNATGNWVKIAQRVPVRIRLDAAKNMPPLRAGLSATVQVDTGFRRRLLGLAL